MKRILLFVLTNVLIMTTISIILSIPGVNHYIEGSGINFSFLLIFCLFWGMTGSFISLALSRQMAKWMMGVQIIDPQNPGEYSWLVQTVQQLSRSADLPSVPQIGIYGSEEMNAFATGPTKSRSLVAVSTGILRKMDRGELQGVLGHEISHISNGDMVTMTLIQGVVNSFGMFLSRIIAFVIGQNVDKEKRGVIQMIAIIAMDIIFSFLGYIVICWFSKQREFRADAGAARIAGRQSMISALEALKLRYEPLDAPNQALATLKIQNQSRLAFLFSSHPPIEERINRLKKEA